MADPASSAVPTHRGGVKTSGLGIDNLRKKREQFAVSIRKNKREESQNKRRNLAATLAQATITAAAPANSSPVVVSFAATSTAPPTEPEQEDIQEVEAKKFRNVLEACRACMGTDTSQHLPGVIAVRKFLSNEYEPPIDQTVATGVLINLIGFLSHVILAWLPFFLSFLVQSTSPCFRSLLGTHKYGSSAHIDTIIKMNGITPLIAIVSFCNTELRDQAIWTLGNIAGDNNEHRDICLRMGFLKPLLKAIQEPKSSLSLLKNATWALSNLFRGDPSPDFELVKEGVPTICELFGHCNSDISADALWGVTYLMDAGVEAVDAAIANGVLPKLVGCLMSDDHKIQVPALRAIGNAVSITHEQTQAAINAGVIPALSHLLKSTKKYLKKEATWAISNICAGTKAQIHTVVEYNVFPDLILLCKNADVEIKREAIWAMCNSFAGGAPEDVSRIANAGAIQTVVAYMTCSEPKLVLAVLESVTAILNAGEFFNTDAFLSKFLEAGVLDKLDELQHHENPKIFKKSGQLLEDWFGECGSEEEENIEEPQHAQAIPSTQAPSSTIQQPAAFQFAPPTGNFSFPMS